MTTLFPGQNWLKRNPDRITTDRQDLKNTAFAREEASKESKIQVSQLVFEHGIGVPQQHCLFLCGEQFFLEPTAFAFEQTCALLGADTELLRTMATAQLPDTELLKRFLNWAARNHEPQELDLLWSESENLMRGITPPNGARTWDLAVANWTAHFVESNPDWRFLRAWSSDRALTVELVNDKEVGAGMRCGAVLHSSETGESKVAVYPFLFNTGLVLSVGMGYSKTLPDAGTPFKDGFTGQNQRVIELLLHNFANETAKPLEMLLNLAKEPVGVTVKQVVGWLVQRRGLAKMSDKEAATLCAEATRRGLDPAIPMNLALTIVDLARNAPYAEDYWKAARKAGALLNEVV